MAQVKGEASPAERLSEREFSVFIQLARGQSVAQIADNLKLSPSTVGTHLYHVKQKLGAGNQSELTLIALQWGLIQI
jgi:two-component system, NarL family, invasion response regulator UvrY